MVEVEIGPRLAELVTVAVIPTVIALWNDRRQNGRMKGLEERLTALEKPS